MTNTSQSLVKQEKFEVSYVPFQGDESIKLTVPIVVNMIANPTKSGQTPSERDAIKFAMMCRSRKLNPFEGDCFLIGYDTKEGPQFSIVTSHQAFLKRAEVHPEYDGMESGVIVERDDQVLELEGDFTMEGDKLLGGWARVHFKTRKHPMLKRLKLSRFNKGFGQWSANPEGMIVKCAECDALRSSFPTMLGGMYLREEVVDVEAEAIPNRMRASAPSRLASAPPAISHEVTAPAAPAHKMNAKPKVVAKPAPETEPEPSPEPETEVAAAAPETAPEEPATGEATELDKLTDHVIELGVDEEAFVKFACARYKLSPCSTLAEFAEVAPNRLRSMLLNWEQLKPEVLKHVKP